MAPVLLAVVTAIAFITGAADAADKRVALVIGNASYRSAAVLDNTLNDADTMSTTLKSVGFEVLDGRNLDKFGMGQILGRFAKMVQAADTALVYFAGHGLQFEGENYLLPVDAAIEDEFNLRFETTRLDDVISTLHYTNGVQILVLDACRNNPFVAKLGGATRGFATRGLAPIKRAQGMLIAYATQANDVASDGRIGNSPFTEALAREMKRPGQEIATVFRNVQLQVYTATNGRQLPELSISLLGNFYLNTRETDADAWKKASLSNDRQQLLEFMKTYPESNWIEVARMRLLELEERDRLRREAAGRDQLIRDLAAREDELKGRIKQAEENREKAMTELQREPPKVSQEQDKQETGKTQSDTRERLAAKVEEQEKMVLTLSAERQRIEEERKSAERASRERLDAQTEEPAPNRESGRIALPSKEEQAAFPPNPVAPRPQSASRTPAAKCADILARLQMGEQEQSDLDALRQCRR